MKGVVVGKVPFVCLKFNHLIYGFLPQRRPLLDGRDNHRFIDTQSMVKVQIIGLLHASAPPSFSSIHNAHFLPKTT
jgi:hypothetical protein